MNHDAPLLRTADDDYYGAAPPRGSAKDVIEISATTTPASMKGLLKTKRIVGGFTPLVFALLMAAACAVAGGAMYATGPGGSLPFGGASHLGEHVSPITYVLHTQCIPQEAKHARKTSSHSLNVEHK